MSAELHNQSGPRTEERLIGRLDQMVETGRVTEAEAQQLRAAAAPGEVDDAVRGIRVRHAGAKLREAVESGQITPGEANAFLDRLKSGEHSRSLRALLRKVLRGVR